MNKYKVVHIIYGDPKERSANPAEVETNVRETTVTADRFHIFDDGSVIFRGAG